MPETDGIEAMQAIIGEFSDAKIIMITSHGNNSKNLQMENRITVLLEPTKFHRIKKPLLLMQ